MHVEQAKVIRLQESHRPGPLGRILDIPGIFHQEFLGFTIVPAGDRREADLLIDAWLEAADSSFPFPLEAAPAGSQQTWALGLLRRLARNAPRSAELRDALRRLDLSADPARLIDLAGS